MAEPAHSFETLPIRSTWISANAGSGKTSALVDHVVKLLLLGVSAERICCITYTRAAAAEMRARVIDALRDLLLADDAKCRALTREFLDRPASESELARARLLFGHVLDSTTGGIQLTTIHGFCQQILRAFPLEAKVPPYFTVLEEVESDLITTRAVHDLLSGFGKADEELAGAIGLLVERAGEGKFDMLVRDIFRSRGLWESLWQNTTPVEVKTRLYALHGLAMDARQEDLLAAFFKLPDATDAAIIRAELPQLAAHKNVREKKLVEVLSAWLAADKKTRSEQVEALLTLFLTKEERTPRKEVISKKDYPEGTPLREVFARLTVASETFVAARASLLCAEESYALTLIARDLLDYYGQIKEARSALDYDDLIARTRELFTTAQMMGWVMSKLDHRIDHLLIDEAQDTSLGQWKIARSLVSELVVTSGGIGSGGLPRSLLVVGDEKQSIFSFQGAKPELFFHMQSVFAELLEQGGTRLEPDILDISYRSAPAILKLVDKVAAMPGITASLSAAGVAAEHQPKRKDAVGTVMLYQPIIPEEKAKPEPFTIPTEYTVTRSGAQLLAEAVAKKIAGWLHEGRMLLTEKEHRPLHAGDILVLVRNRKPIVPCLIRALQEEGVPVAGIDRLMLSGHLAVKDLLALMRWVSFQGDDLALAQVLRSPILGFSDEQLRVLAHGRGALSLWERLRDAKEHSATAAQLTRWIGHKSATPYDSLTQLLEVDDARRRFAERFGEEVHEVLDELKEQAARLPSHLAPGLASFAAFIAGSAREVKREQEARGNGEVRIMTIYGAKGLEAPIVLLVDTVRVPDLGHERIYTSGDAHGRLFPVLKISDDAKFAPVLEEAREARRQSLFAEYHRLLYVALTRARDELHIFAAGEAKKKIPESSWYAIVDSALRASPGVTEHEDGSVSLRDAGKTKIAAQASPPEDASTEALPAWANTQAARPKRTAVIAPSQLQASAALAPFSRYQPEAAKERGVRIHRALQFLGPWTSREELAVLLGAIAPDWDRETCTAIEKEIWKLYQQEHWLWQHESHAEVSISGEIEIEGAMVVVNGQIDRLVKTPEGPLILDYKTGRHIPDSASQVPTNYLLQLKTYAALLRSMEPETRLRCAILWTSGPRLMELTEAVDAISWQAKNSF